MRSSRLILTLLGAGSAAFMIASVGCNSQPKQDAKSDAEMRDNFKGQPDLNKVPPDQRAKIEAIMKANGGGPSRPTKQ